MIMEGTDLGGVPVEFDGAIRLEVGFQQSSVGFQNGDSAATIVIGTLQGHRSETQTLSDLREETLTRSRKEWPHVGACLSREHHEGMGIRRGVPVLMGRNDDDLIWRSRSVDGGDLNGNSVRLSTVGQVVNTYDRTLIPGMRELSDSNPLLERRGRKFGGDLEASQTDPKVAVC